MTTNKPSSYQGDRAILSVVLSYAVFCVLWILVSDRLVEWLPQRSPLVDLVSMFEDWVFVGITTLLLYQSMRHRFGRAKAAQNADDRPAERFRVGGNTTESLRSEETLRKLSQALEQSPESIVITDIDAKIEYVNEAFVRSTGYSREEMMGQNPKVLNSGKTPPETFRAMWRTLTEGKTWKGEFANKRKDGSEYLEFAIISPIHQANGRITHYVAAKEDITEKTRLCKELDAHRYHLEELVAGRTTQLAEAFHQAELANHAKCSFLANVSHEIRTPMNAIVGLTHLLRRDRPTPEQAERLTRISIAADQLLSIVNDILDLSRMDAGKLSLEQTELSLPAILDSARAMIAEQAEAKGLAIRIECDDFPVCLQGDPTRLSQALFNLAGNAVKFTNQGVIALRARLIEDDGEHLLIRMEVEDTGIGIDIKKLSGLFQPFVQADVSSTRQYGGTGLGLAITQRLAKLMGGEAGVDSKTGGGSTFWFSVRLARSHPYTNSATTLTPADESEAEMLLRSMHCGARLLLVEDNPVNRGVILDLILAAGLKADTAENGEQAIKKASMLRYDLILMDVQMPTMNGLEATRVIRHQPCGNQVPILAMTGNAFAEARQACQEAGMNDFVAKPVTPNDFYATLLKWLIAKAQSISPTPRSPAQPPDDSRLHHLASITDLDISRGLTTMRGNIANYKAVLGLFARECSAHANRIAEMRDKADFSAIEPLASTLHGNAIMLGALRIAESADSMALACRSDTSTARINSFCGVLINDLLHFAIAIQESATVPAASASSGIDLRQLGDVLTRLETLLEHGNIEANHLAIDQAGLLLSVFGKSAKVLIGRIEAFDYERAITELRQIRTHLRAGTGS